MLCESIYIEGLKILTPRVFGDDRGWFYEPWNTNTFTDLGICHPFLQDNHSRSVKNTIRGLHYQSSPGQAKLVRCTVGKIWDVAVDIRKYSPTFGKWHAVELNAETKQMFYIPNGFAHGFCVLSDWAEVQYKASNVYDPSTECGLAWDDPDLNINWPITDPILSERDCNNQSLRRFSTSLF